MSPRLWNLKIEDGDLCHKACYKVNQPDERHGVGEAKGGHPEGVEEGPGHGHGREAHQPHHEERGQPEDPGDGQVGVGASDQEQADQS